ncbi:solute carrier family 41 member 1 isoform X1 [Dermatophagoides farinae]|uniref:solute carrier family 41 member 1 isoform X1 n=1 Tax=Dermatophagoides farinae TaxID=6954 RepID=UPI003F61B4F8
MESCNSRQGLLLKSFSANSDFSDDYHQSQIINNNDNVPQICLDNYGSSDITSNGGDGVQSIDGVTTSTSTTTSTTADTGPAKFFIGDGDETMTVSSHQSNSIGKLANSREFDKSSCSSNEDDDHMATMKQSNTESTIIIMDQSPSSSPVPIDPFDMIMAKGNDSTLIDDDDVMINERLHFLTNWPDNIGRTNLPVVGGGGGPLTDKHFVDDQHDNNEKQHHQHGGIGSSWQIFMAVMIAASGNFIAGLILDNSKSWNVFLYTPELYYLVPILLSLKGNLEMTMVARLSTLANMGMLKSVRRVLHILLYNISLVQTQAIIVSFLASIVTLLALRMEGESDIDLPIIGDATLSSLSIINATTNANTMQQQQQLHLHGDGTALTRKCLLIFSTSLATANVACLLSTVIMITLTIALHYYNVNPDNFVTALAASFGDIITSFLIGVIGEFINERITYQPTDNDAVFLLDSVRYHDDLQSPMMAILIIMLFIAIFPLLAWFSCRDESNRKILLGLGAWLPILLSMLIAFVSGFVLRFGAVAFNFMSLFQPLINGVGGNLAAITTSRYSTELHKQKAQETIVTNLEHRSASASTASSSSSSSSSKSPLKSVMSSTLHSFLRLSDNRNQMILLYILMAIAVHLFYGILAPAIHTSDHHHITWLFYMFYIPATILQVLLLLIVTRFFVDFVWWLHYDPDTSAIPILTSLGDILGTVFLYIVFILLQFIGDQSAAPPLNNIDDLATGTVDIAANLISTTTTTSLPTLYEFITKNNDPIRMAIALVSNENPTTTTTTNTFIRHLMMNPTTPTAI